MTFLTKKSLSRRTMLRGLGATVALPMLDSMIPALSAQAKPLPGRDRTGIAIINMLAKTPHAASHSPILVVCMNSSPAVRERSRRAER